MIHNTEGENPLDAPNIQEETNAFPSNGSGLYSNNKRALAQIHTPVEVWCSEFGTEVFEGRTQQTMHNRLVSGQMSTSLLESWHGEMLQTFPSPKAPPPPQTYNNIAVLHKGMLASPIITL
jgi:hypothetical protein